MRTSRFTKSSSVQFCQFLLKNIFKKYSRKYHVDLKKKIICLFCINPIGIQITVGNNLNSVAIFMHPVRNIFHPLKISFFFWGGGV